MPVQLYPHQVKALEETKDFNRVAYYLDMGLGKTFVGSEKMVQLRSTVNLIVCQKSKIQDWVDHFKELYKCHPLNLTNSVLISASATAEAYTDTQLQNYSTTAQIQVTTDAITAEVNRKFNTSDWSTTLRLSASDIQFAWNNISKYIQFENAELCIYDSVDEQNHLLRTKFNDEGNHFYRDGYYVGKVGTNSAAIYILLSSKPDDWEINFSNYYRKIRDNYVKISGDSAPTFVENHFYEKDTTHKGLVFDLDSQGKYMAFAQKSRSGENTNYTTMLCFSRANSIYDEYGLHLGCDLYGHYNTIHDVYLDGVRTFIGNSSVPSHTGDIEFVSDCSLSNGQLTVTKKTLKISNGIVYGIINS